jgi:hypothetical protein
MGRANEFRDYAIKCEQLAAKFAPGEGRESLLYLAARWHRMAENATPLPSIENSASGMPDANAWHSFENDQPSNVMN